MVLTTSLTKEYVVVKTYTINMDELNEYIINQNPHWTNQNLNTGVERTNYLNKITDSINYSKEIIIIGGVRRAGKTTLMYQTINYLINSKKINPKNILFISCDTPLIKNLDQPLETIIDRYQKLAGTSQNIWLFFDEIQSINEFQITIKNLHDSGKYKIIISGSTSHILKSKSGTYLTGRYIPIQVYPLSFSEYLNFKKIKKPKSVMDAQTQKYELIGHLNNYMSRGGFPAAVSIENESVRKDLLKAYYDGIVYRDIINSHNVKNQSVMIELMSYLITNISNPQTYRKLAEMFKTEPSTVQDYISYALDGNLIYSASKFDFSYKKQIVAPKKIYVVDTGLRDVSAFVFSKDYGRLAENIVCFELLRRGFEPKYFKENSEIDFVVKDESSSITLINVCYSDKIPTREYEGFADFNKAYPEIPVRKIILTDNVEGESDGVSLIPLWKWLIS
ncbi:MAG: ATP-binding protein [Methanocorpusculum sp.]|nr:ATP-binding protein [Methanocorpusculum sp.]